MVHVRHRLGARRAGHGVHRGEPFVGRVGRERWSRSVFWCAAAMWETPMEEGHGVTWNMIYKYRANPIGWQMLEVKPI